MERQPKSEMLAVIVAIISIVLVCLFVGGFSLSYLAYRQANRAELQAREAMEVARRAAETNHQP